MSKLVLQQAPASLLIFLVAVASVVTRVSSRQFTITNRCGYTVWAGILSSSGSSPLEPTGFSLSPGESRTLHAPHKWSGRIWARTHCATDSAGRFSCATGNCGSGHLECSGHGAAPPATLAEFTLDGHEGLDFYDVSLVDGYNQPVLVQPEGPAVGSSCVPTGCMVDLNGVCPAELRVAQEGGGVACKSACEAFGSPEHCCSGAHGGPDTCVQLRLRRRHVHLHVRRGEHVLRHHLLPQHQQRQGRRVGSQAGRLHRELEGRVLLVGGGVAHHAVASCVWWPLPTPRGHVPGASSRVLSFTRESVRAPTGHTKTSVALERILLVRLYCFEFVLINIGID
ncbi:hypothetical protein QOZ80_2AG0129790 [Eleusine coracana subsp. coracana]|nr:hypothetical protein QOZ80_2AG0129790 [Eleusine coracana subsp. coracana]